VRPPSPKTRLTHHALRFTFHVLRIACCAILLTACQVSGSTRPTVKIGLVAPFEGRYRYAGYDVIYAVRLALREANAAGGVAGYSVELVAYDDGGDPIQAAVQARKLAVDPAIVAAIGHFREETTSTALSVYAEAGIPLVVPAVLHSPLTEEQGQVYYPGPPAATVAGEMLSQLRSLGQRQAALVTGGGSLGEALQWAAQQHRLRVSPVVSPENKDWMDKILASGVETVFCDADPVTAGEVVAALREIEWEGAFLGGPELAAADFSAVAGEAAEGAMFVTPYPFPADTPGSADFIAAYQAVSNSIPPGPLALPAYQATWTLLESLERNIAAHGRPTREGIGALNAERDRSYTPLYWYRVGAGGMLEKVDKGAADALQILVRQVSWKHNVQPPNQ